MTVVYFDQHFGSCALQTLVEISFHAHFTNLTIVLHPQVSVCGKIVNVIIFILFALIGAKERKMMQKWLKKVFGPNFGACTPKS